MTAKEMFEKLGYEHIISNKFPNEIKYKYLDDYITFDFEDKTIWRGEDYDSAGITMEELKAINKQIEELGWLEGDNICN